MKKIAVSLRVLTMICTAIVLTAAISSTIDVIWEPDLQLARIAALRASCQNNLKQTGLVIRMYTDDQPGEYFPPLSPEDGRLMFVKDEIYPTYWADPIIFLCPGRFAGDPPPDFDDTHHVYLGYAMGDDADVLNFADAYRAEIAAGGDFSDDITTPGGVTIQRLQEGIERFFITDINNPAAGSMARSQIPVMMDWPDNFQAGWGGNVLYMDGHVEWKHYPDEWPMTETTITALAELANYVPPTIWGDGDNPFDNEFPDYHAWFWEMSMLDRGRDPEFWRYVESSGRSNICAGQLHDLGDMYKIYASHASGNTWPALSTEAGRLTPIPDDIHPEYLYSPDYFICPGPVPILPEPFLDDQHYVYLGYMLQDDADAVNFATAYTAQLAGGGDFTGDLTATASYGSGTELLRLKEGMERFLITDINNPPVNLNTPSTIPVMIEWPGNHDGATGGHVLYMDGRTEWIAYPGKWPMTTTTIAALDSIANWTPSTEWPQWEPYSISPDDPYRFKGSCESNLKQLGLVGRMYADEHGEIWPALPTEAGLLMMPEADLYHEYLHASEVTLCPAAITEDPPPFWEDRHYVYLGYFMMNDADVQAFADAYTAQLAGGGDFTTNLNTPSSYGDHLLRLENGLERFLITDINSPTLPYLGLKSTVPVMIEWPDNHENLSGGHVLYLDGHVEWHDYPGEWPMTEATITTLDGIATWIRSTEWATREFASDTGDPHKLLVCGSNVKNFGLMMKIYANDNRGSYYPDLNPTADKLTFIADQVGPHYLRDFRKMNCPGSPKALKIPVMDDHSYAYLGYLVQDETELQQFAAAYRAQIAAGGDFSEDLDFGGETILRIREGIERFLITDINNPAAANAHQADIPVLVEWPDNHGNLRGGWVLYMDGHAEWFDYPSTFPMTEEAMAILTDLAGRPPIAAPEPARDSSRLTDLLLQDGESTRR